MKETKKFFDNNRLNKGYSRINNHYKTDSSHIREQFKHVLPPIDMMTEYEELCPGVFKHLLDMAKTEQSHRHSLDLVIQEKYNQAKHMGRIFSLIVIAVISITTLLLTFFGYQMVAALFSLGAFGTLSLVSYLYSNFKLSFFSKPFVKKSLKHKPVKRYNNKKSF